MTHNLVSFRFSEQRYMILNLCTFLGHQVFICLKVTTSQSHLGINFDGGEWMNMRSNVQFLNTLKTMKYNFLMIKYNWKLALPIHTSIHTSIHPYIHTSIHPYIHTSIHPYIHTSIHPYIHTSIHPYIHPSEWRKFQDIVVTKWFPCSTS